MFNYKYCYDNNGYNPLETHKKPSSIIVVTRSKTDMLDVIFATGKFIQFGYYRYSNGTTYAESCSLVDGGGIINELPYGDILMMLNMQRFIADFEDQPSHEFNFDLYHYLYVTIARRIKNIENILTSNAD